MGLFDRLFPKKTADAQPRLQVGLGSVPYPPPPPPLPVVVDEPTGPLAPIAQTAFTESLERQFGAARGARLARLSERLLYAAITGPPPFIFLEGNERGVGGGWRSERWRFTFAGDDLVRFAGVDGLPIFLAETLVDVKQHQEAILTLCAQNDGRVLRTAADMKRLRELQPGRHTVVDAAVAAQWEPPHFDGRALRFVVDSDVDVVRVVVDADSYAVDLHVLGPTAQRDAVRNIFTMPPVVVGRAYVDDAGHVVVGASAVSSRFADQALGEQASVASFARLTLELMAVGAPLSLLARVQEAALDEVRHARVCADLARVHDGVDVEFGAVAALAPRAGDKQTIARRTEEEAVGPEAASVAALSAEAEVVGDADVRDALLAIVADEERHVQLARDIIRWCEGVTHGH